jgi:hypothetical protein
MTFYESWAREFEQRFPGVKVIMKAAQTPPASPRALTNSRIVVVHGPAADRVARNEIA